MSGRICPIHGVEFFKTEKMKGYAHPIKDAAGKPVYKNGKQAWCNEEDLTSGEPEPQAAPHEDKPFEPAINQQKQASIEAQNARTNLTQLCVAGKLADEVELSALELALVSQLTSFAGLHFDGGYKAKGGATEAPIVKAAKDMGAVEKKPSQFKHQGDFLTRCHQEYDLQRPAVEARIGYPVNAQTDLDEAWRLLVELVTP